MRSEPLRGHATRFTWQCHGWPVATQQISDLTRVRVLKVLAVQHADARSSKIDHGKRAMPLLRAEPLGRDASRIGLCRNGLYLARHHLIDVNLFLRVHAVFAMHVPRCPRTTA